MFSLATKDKVRACRSLLFEGFMKMHSDNFRGDSAMISRRNFLLVRGA